VFFRDVQFSSRFSRWRVTDALVSAFTKDYQLARKEFILGVLRDVGIGIVLSPIVSATLLVLFRRDLDAQWLLLTVVEHCLFSVFAR